MVKSAKIMVATLLKRKIYGEFTAPIHDHVVFKNIAVTIAFYTISNYCLKNKLPR